MALGCAKGRPDNVLLQSNQETYDHGGLLISDGEAMMADGKQQVSDGEDLRERAERMIEQGNERRERGEELAARGREAMRSAHMLEEAEQLRQEGARIKGAALPKPE